MNQRINVVVQSSLSPAALETLCTALESIVAMPSLKLKRREEGIKG